MTVTVAFVIGILFGLGAGLSAVALVRAPSHRRADVGADPPIVIYVPSAKGAATMPTVRSQPVSSSPIRISPTLEPDQRKEALRWLLDAARRRRQIRLTPVEPAGDYVVEVVDSD